MSNPFPALPNRVGPRLPRIVATSLVVVWVLVVSAFFAALAAEHDQRLDPAVQAAVAHHGRARVIVLLRDPLPLDAGDRQREQAVAEMQEAVLATLGSGFRLVRRFEYVPAMAAEVTQQGLETLLAHPLVVRVERDAVHVPLLAESARVLGADVVHEDYGVTGAGVNVAVLDTGIDPKHPDLADDIVAQHCFASNGGCRPNNSTESDDAQDENGHGTGVAGIITANGEVSPRGIAPDAGIIAVRVFDDKAQAQTSDILAGLEWLRRNRRELGVKIVNMSLGSQEVYSGNCDSVDQARARLIGQLNALGIAVFAASGNNGATNGMTMPACLSNVISVGATYDARLGRQPAKGLWGAGCADEFTSPETIACFTNVGRTLSLVAPGAMIRHPRLGGGTTETAGTSNASPMAAGVAALLLQVNPELRPAELERLLQRTGTDLKHPQLAMSFRRINARSAVEQLRGTPPRSPTAEQTPSPSETPTYAPPSPIATDGTPRPTETTREPTASLPTPVATASPTAIVWPTDTPSPAATPSLTVAVTLPPHRAIHLPCLFRHP